MKCKIKKFDPTNIKPGRIILIIGKRGSGKSTLLRDILYRMKDTIDFGMAMTPTQDSASMFRSCLPSGCVYDKFIPAKVDGLVKVAKDMKFHGKHKRLLLCLDDCMYDKSCTKGISMRTIFFNGRHLNICFINILQYCMDLTSDLRTQIDYVFALRENILANKIRLWKYFFGMFSHYDDFAQVLDRCTNNYETLVLDNTVNSTSIQDCVYWYRADTGLPDFRIGNDVFFKMNEDAALTRSQKLAMHRLSVEEEEEPVGKRGRTRITFEKDTGEDEEEGAGSDER